jgi:hypothetical protein
VIFFCGVLSNGVMYADMEFRDGVEGKQYHDIVSGYQIFDILDRQVNHGRKEPVIFIDHMNNPLEDGFREELSDRHPGMAI